MYISGGTASEPDTPAFLLLKLKTNTTPLH
jgi:hypothetical protein